MKRDKLRESVDLIREVFFYTRRFKNQTFVFQIENSIIEGENFHSLIKDLAMLKESGINIVIVPGAHDHIDRILKQYNVQTNSIDGIRISTSETIPFIKMAAFDVANSIMTSLSRSKIPAVIGNWVHARGKGVIKGIDYQETGVVDKIYRDPLFKVINDDLVPIFPCIGWNSLGKPYNISSRDLASSISITLGSSKLFFIGEHDKLGGVSQMSLKEAKQYRGYAQGLVELGVNACENGVTRVHIIDGRVEGIILKEIFSNTGEGTMIHSNAYEQIRPMINDDIPDVLKIMKPYIEDGILLSRTKEQMEECLHDFVVYEIDNKIHACGALHLKEDGFGEIAALATDLSSKTNGSGKAIVDYLLSRGEERNAKMIFVLTTKTSDWFESIGFKKGNIDDLPIWKKEKYNLERNSRIYIKKV
ncbi:amino-acid N-acetyltransferase [Thiospirochaeta perfilievii]|uniref:amino-acid N-acetyltransferase n=1 Tax=Thiospirochaeta perfilievii TaxID=252967 RepID=A0A5C1QEB0_9SPIO|nr:amino-acid N-acetyltransferase [Thiospirochaeta perfilievii]QEN04986.1 amino-acid N-acetyltransferase [Thiospirochaeta perfilievii]